MVNTDELIVIIERIRALYADKERINAAIKDAEQDLEALLDTGRIVIPETPADLLDTPAFGMAPVQKAS